LGAESQEYGCEDKSKVLCKLKSALLHPAINNNQYYTGKIQLENFALV